MSDSESVLDGTTYPKDNAVVAEIDDRREAEAAAQALRQAGFAQEAIHLVTGRSGLAHIHARERHLSPWARFWRAFRTFGGDEDLDRETQLQALAHGHALLGVLTPTEADVERAHRVLVAHHAKTIRAFGQTTVTNLPQRIE
ncbi:MAG TPA: hypothetical protein VKQ36_03545 [Ktedonobacterales bacterium]|nr:hypothetical protein [Ktedonobacterales bacterium]